MKDVRINAVRSDVLMARYNYRFEIYDTIYQVTMSTHEWYRIWCEDVELYRGGLPFMLADDAEDNQDYMNGYAACLLDIFLEQEDGEFPLYKRGSIRQDLWEDDNANPHTISDVSERESKDG